EEVKISVGGFSEGYEYLEVNFIENKIRYMHSLKTKGEYIQKEIERVEIEDFIEKLKEIKLVTWKANYSELGVCDGTQWSIKIDTATEKIEKYGDNKYPPQWKGFCKLIEKVKIKNFKDEIEKMEE
ncbi:MAG: hypothetical protein ACRC28_03935, partial [Clostridium sp.]